MSSFVRTPWGVECFLIKTEFGYKNWALLPSNLSDDEILAKIKDMETAALPVVTDTPPTEETK